MTTELTTKNEWPKAKIDLITKTVAVGATKDELELFLYTCKKTGLDPLTHQIHFVKRKDKMTIQTGIDGYRVIAERTGTLAGIDDVIFDSEDQANPNKASVTVYRIIGGTRVPFTASARWNEYAQWFFDKDTQKQKLGNMWQKMPYLMLAKCAESLALRKAFPNDLSGIYTNEEMQQADNQTPVDIVQKPHQPEIVPDPDEQPFAGNEFVQQSQGEQVRHCDVPGCGGVMKQRNGARGPFLGCSKFPNCRNIKSII